MGKKLRVSIGPHRDKMETAWVNDRPTIIDTDLFVGRAFIKIRDFVGVTPDGSEPVALHPSFEGRSRAFEIQLEGRFKERDGVAPYTGEEVHFGSDFDELIDFPKTAFSAGIRVASWIDPAMRYQFDPPSKRPYIMSPMLTSVNLLAAWPAPDRFSDAVICLRHTEHSHDEHGHGFDSNEGSFDMIPVESLDDPEHAHGKKKVPRTAKRYWRFVGLAGDPRIDAFVEKNKQLLAPRDLHHHHDEVPVPPSSTSTTSSNIDLSGKAPRSPSSSTSASVATNPVTVTTTPSSTSATANRIRAPSISRPLPQHQISFGATTHRDEHHEASVEKEAEQLKQQMQATQELETVQEHHDEHETQAKKHSFGMGGLKSALGGGKGNGSAKDHSPSTSTQSTPDTTPSISRTDTPASIKTPSLASSKTKTKTPLDVAHAPELKDVDKGDLGFADQLSHLPSTHGADEDPVEAQLGPWRFGDPSTDLLEDNTFVYLNKSVDVAKRRKYFNESGGKHRKEFTFDPDVVYAAAFFSPFMDFNNFNLHIGPVNMNVAGYFERMPVRYTLRSTRYVPGTVEEETFVTIAFELVDA